MSLFKLTSEYQPSGDQPEAISQLIAGLDAGEKEQVLLGATGTGKTFTMANIIARTGRPAIIMAHNKTLAAQLYSEMKGFFPHNAVEYFVSYYDYYQPEAYVAKSDTYIEKDSSINEQIDRMRHSATRAMFERPNEVIVVASVSCIYGIGSAECYAQMVIELAEGQSIKMQQLAARLVELQYERHDADFQRGSFRIKGDVLDIFPSHLEDTAWRIAFWGDEIEEIKAFDPLTGNRIDNLDKLLIFPNSHYVTPRPTLLRAIDKIQAELKTRLEQYHNDGNVLYAQRLEERTMFDIEMIRETGSCKGIENYSRYLSGRGAGQPPPTLFEYIPKDAILFVDESHVSVPQIGGMYNGDRARKLNLAEYGFRLPSCMDNRPLKFEEWDKMRPQSIFVSATPGKWEMEQTSGVVAEQIIRPTGLVDPICEVRPISNDNANQVEDVMAEARKVIENGMRVMITTLTKKMAEDLASYMAELRLRVKYLHSDINTVERVEIIRDLRLGEFDVLIGVNLLREGLDIPECGLMAILDADKEGFLRSRTSLIQTIGRAARNAEARVILYADVMTRSLKEAIEETERRREIQLAYNKQHNITPKTVSTKILEIGFKSSDNGKKNAGKGAKGADKSKQANPFGIPETKELLASPGKLEKEINRLRKQMFGYAENMEFEQAALIRDEIAKLEKMQLQI